VATAAHEQPLGARYSALRHGLVLIAAAGLAVDAFIHLNLASDYAPIKTSVISQAGLFRLEAILAIIAALALLIHPRRYTAAIAFAVTGGGLAALLIYRYANVGRLGPLPNMYEPVWFTKKLVAAYAEAAASVAAAVLAVIIFRSSKTTGRQTHG
jgi:hypothetical protein